MFEISSAPANCKPSILISDKPAKSLLSFKIEVKTSETLDLATPSTCPSVSPFLPLSTKIPLTCERSMQVGTYSVLDAFDVALNLGIHFFIVETRDLGNAVGHAVEAVVEDFGYVVERCLS